MNIKKAKGDNEIYLAESSTKGKYWKVNAEKRTCNCPNFLFRQRSHGGACKHISAVLELINKVKTPKDDFEKAIEYMKSRGTIDSIELIDKYSEGLINELIERGELIEEKGKIRILNS